MAKIRSSKSLLLTCQTGSMAGFTFSAVEPDYLQTSWEWNWWFVRMFVYDFLIIAGILVLLFTLISIARSLKVLAANSGRYSDADHTTKNSQEQHSDLSE